MPPSLYQIRTRLGVFDTMTLAAAAHGVSRSTIFLRTVDDPERLQKRKPGPHERLCGP